MSQSTTELMYQTRAIGWSERIERLGYSAAYRGFFARTLPKPAQRVCDIGTGCGDFASAYLHAGATPQRLAIVDCSDRMLKQAGARLGVLVGNVVCAHCDLETFWPDHSFEHVLCAHVIEHCLDAHAGLARLWELVAPGGKLFLVVSKPHWCQWPIWIRWRHRWFSAEKVSDLARIAGLPEPDVHSFPSGPPRRTSLAYVFSKKHPI